MVPNPTRVLSLELDSDIPWNPGLVADDGTKESALS